MKFRCAFVVWKISFVAWGLVFGLAPRLQAQGTIAPDPKYAAISKAIESLVQREIETKELPAVSIALVDGKEIVWAKGFGFADPRKKTPATAETVYRVGSVSKLFTDVGIMQLVEKGVLDLDAPVTRYIPNFKPVNPSNKPITLRQLMSHRSGLVREPPLGHYFDPVPPSLKQTVESLNSTRLVYAPEEKTKYSNAGISVVGYVLERVLSEPFERCLRRRVLDPLGMSHSGFVATPELQKDLASASMWTYHGRSFEAPTFPLGIAPAGCMYSTVTDLGQFMIALFSGGQGKNGAILEKGTLEKMWEPQFAKPGEKVGFGIGFHLGEMDGHRSIGHDGAIYGFATTLTALPDDQLGVVVVTTVDCANAVTDHIGNSALKLMLAQKTGKPLPTIEETQAVPPDIARRLAGRYEHEGQGMDLVASGRKLWSVPRRGGFWSELRMMGDGFITDDRLERGRKLSIKPDQIEVANQKFARKQVKRPEPAPEKFAGLIGEYGWDHDILYILEKDGKLHALIEWFFDYPLDEVSADVYKFPNWGLYDGEKLIFTRDAKGRSTEVLAASVLFKRRAIDGENGATFKIRPLLPIEELRRNALAAQPPKEAGIFDKSDPVEVITLDDSIKLDIRYATANNFLNAPLYTSARAFLQRPAAEGMVRAHRKLKEQGYGLLIHDGYRPWSVTKMFWDATPTENHIFVADPQKGSRHNRGCAVDLTLYDLETGQPIQMVGGYDEFSDRSYPDYPGGTSLQRWHREFLRSAMEEQGFTVYEAEWWHFDYKDWRKYAIGTLTFEELQAARRE